MSRALWGRFSRLCAGKNKDGSPCGNRVATTHSGVYVRGRYCHVHRKRSVS